MNSNSYLQKHRPYVKHIGEMVSQWIFLLVANFFLSTNNWKA